LFLLRLLVLDTCTSAKNEERQSMPIMGNAGWSDSKGGFLQEEADEGTDKRTTIVVVVLSWCVSCVGDEGPAGPASERGALADQVLILQIVEDGLQTHGAKAAHGIIKSDDLVRKVDTHEDPVNAIHIHREEEEALLKDVHTISAWSRPSMDGPKIIGAGALALVQAEEGSHEMS
jgi:hypothetical protein